VAGISPFCVGGVTNTFKAKGDDEDLLCHLGSQALNWTKYSLRYKNRTNPMTENRRLEPYSASDQDEAFDPLSLGDVSICCPQPAISLSNKPRPWAFRCHWFSVLPWMSRRFQI
jgi:hypothetical protein